MGAFYIIKIIEREAAESAAARRPPDDHAALDAIRSNPSIVRRVFAAMRHRTDSSPGGPARGRPEARSRGAGALGARPEQRAGAAFSPNGKLVAGLRVRCWAVARPRYERTDGRALAGSPVTGRALCGMTGHCLGKPERILMRAFQAAADAACSSDELQTALDEPPFCTGMVPPIRSAGDTQKWAI